MPALLQWFRDRPRLADVLVACLVAVAELAQALTITASDVNDDVIEPKTAAHWFVIILGPATVIFYRTHPLSALAVGAAATMTAWMMDLSISGLAGAFVLFGAVRYGPTPLGLRAATGTAILLFSFSLLGVTVGEAPIYILPLVAWIVTMPILAAMNIKSNNALLDASSRRLVHAEERREADKQAAITDERTRVARELHDVVAHGLSLIVVQAGAGMRILDKAEDNGSPDSRPQPDRHQQTSQIMANIDKAARQSLGEMRQILGILRDEDADADTQWRPAPEAMTITELVAQAAETGLDVTFETVGEPRTLPTAVGAAAYRIVQESLTNVRKHGGPMVKAHVTGTFGARELKIRVEDDGRGAAAPDSDGHGLIGMKERTELLGGDFRSGPRVGGGFRVEVKLPIEPVTSEIQDGETQDGEMQESEMQESETADQP